MLNITSSEFSISNQPAGVDTLTHRIYYSSELSGYLEEFEGSLTFIKSDYAYLRGRFLNDGCAVVPITLTDSCGLELSANLFLNDATWRPDRCTVECQVTDASFLSLIDNNKGIKAYVNVGRSKNDVPITAVVQSDLKYKAYDVVNNTDTPANRSGVRVYDALRMLVEFMSDGLIGFESDFFFPDDDPSINRPRIPTLVTGRAIRTNADDSFPFISFEQLYKDLNKLYNLAFAIERVGGNVVLRIEPKSYFRQTSTSLSMLNVDELEQTSDQSSFYSRVTYGSAKVDEYLFYPGGASPPSLPFVQWSQEEYHLGGQCNNQSVLELQLETLISDTNVIMRCLPFGGANPQSIVNPADSSYDDDVFIVLFDANNQTIVSTNPLDSDLTYYNGRITNSEVAQRWGDGIPYPIFLFLDGIANNDARGGLSVDAPVDIGASGVVPSVMGAWMADNGYFTQLSAVMEFPARTPPYGYDTSLNMADGILAAGFDATWYEAPNTGIYTVETFLRWDGDMRGFVIIQVRGFTLIQTSQPFYNSPDVIPYTDRTASGTLTVAAAAGDRFYVVCFLGGAAAYSPPIPPIPPILKTGSYMEVAASGNQITQTYDPADNYLVNTKFAYPIAPQTWVNFGNSRYGEIIVSHANGQVKGILKDANRNLHTGKTDWILRSNFGDS